MNYIGLKIISLQFFLSCTRLFFVNRPCVAWKPDWLRHNSRAGAVL